MIPDTKNWMGLKNLYSSFQEKTETICKYLDLTLNT